MMTMNLFFLSGEQLSLFGSGQNTYIGMDIGSSHVKVVGLKSNSSKRPKLFGAGVASTPPGSVMDGAIANINAVKKAVLLATQQAGLKIKGQSITVGLRGLNVLYKRMVLPYQEEAEMAEQILREAQQQIDSDLDDWVVDHQIITEKDDQGQVAVMLVAGKRGVIEDLQNLIIELGGRPSIVDCDVFAIANAYELSFGTVSAPTLFLDIGKETTKVHFAAADGVPAIVRSFSLGGQNLTELIGRMMSMDFGRAEALKISASQTGSLFKDKRLAESTRTHINEVISELSQTLDFYSSIDTSEENKQIKNIVLSGGGSTTAGLAQALSQHFKAKAQFLDPFSMIDFPRRTQPPEDVQPHVFATGVGLALRYLGDKPL